MEITHRKSLLFLLIILLVLITACSDQGVSAGDSIPEPDLSNPDEGFSPEDFGGGTGNLPFGGDQSWPEYIPADIPEFVGDISLVMEAPESHIRIFYENVTQRQIEDYLNELEQAGFDLEYIVYVREGFPDNSEERIAKGEYDAVDITKGEYHMNLSFGGSQATYDVYTSGFEAEAIAATTPKWPTDLDRILPPPERCELTRVIASGQDDLAYTIMCKPEDAVVFDDYVNVLKEMGFYKNPQLVSFDESQLLTLIDGAMSVEVSNSVSSELMLRIEKQQDDIAALEWPQDLEGLVPAPARCEIESIIPSDKFMISCVPEDSDVLPDYVHALSGLGFEEDNLFEGTNGEIISVSLNKGGLMVEIMGGASDSIMIRIEQDGT